MVVPDLKFNTAVGPVRHQVVAILRLGVTYFLMRSAFFLAGGASAATIVAGTFFGVTELFPNLFPSSLGAKFSFTAFIASSSPLTLKIMLIVVLLLVPVVQAHQVWAEKLLSGKLADDDLAHEEMY